MRYNLISYLIGDGVKNITKNKKSTFSALIIMVVTMMTVGICYVIGENVKAILNEMESGYPIEVYIENGTTDAEKSALEAEIKNIEYVNDTNIKHVTKQEAYYQAKEKLGDESVVELQGYTEDEHPFPESFIITLTDLNKLNEVVEKIENLDNVLNTSEGGKNDEEQNGTAGQTAKKTDEKKSKAETLTSFNKNVNIVLLAVGGVLVIFSVIIIGNTIKLTVHARRKEISIMKYVGATNNFIRAPFVVEGIIIGIISSLISIILLGGLYVWIKRSIIGSALKGWLQNFGMSVGVDDLLHFDQMFLQIMVIFLAIGIGIGVLGSIRSMKKYLKV